MAGSRGGQERGRKTRVHPLAERQVLALDEIREGFLEAGLGEAEGIGVAGVAAEAMPLVLETAYRLGDGLRLRPIEEEPGRSAAALDHRLPQAAPPQTDHRGAFALHLDRKPCRNPLPPRR